MLSASRYQSTSHFPNVQGGGPGLPPAASHPGSPTAVRPLDKRGDGILLVIG